MSSEFMSLSWVLALQLVMWVPYIINTIMVRGLVSAVGYPDNPPPIARMKKAHYNSVENLAVFASLVLMANAVGITNDTTVMACEVYFWARLVHLAAYTFAVPWVRTLSFTAAWVCLVLLLLQLI
jgi:uncharacterized membrane protein YecN with MAPEG domain